MRNIIILILLLIGSDSFGQSRTYIGTANELNTRLGGYQAQRWFRPPMYFYNWSSQDSAGMMWFDSAGTRTLWYHNGVNRVQLASGSSGTVTSLTAGFGLTGGTITTSGTINVNTSVIATKSALDSVAGLISTDVVDSATLADSMALKLSIRDSATRYVTPKRLADSTAAVRAAIPSVTGFVPYSGATTNVNLGGFGLLARKFTGDTLQASGSMGIHIHGTGGTGIMVGAGGGGNVTFDSYPTTVAGDSVLTTNSSGGLLRFNLKNKLANYLLVSDTASLSNRINLKLNSADTASLSNRINLKLNSSDTASLSNRINTKLNSTDTASLSNRINARIPYSDTTNNILTKNNIITIRGKRFVYTSRTAANYTTSVTIPADTLDAITITAQAGSLLFNAPSGTPTNFQQLVICIRDNGTPRALTFNAAFKGGDLTLPTTTVANRFMYIYFLYNENDARWYLTGKPGGYAP
jgi:hypothetical protein